MALTIDLPTSLKQRLETTAKRHAVGSEELVCKILEEHLNQFEAQRWHEEIVDNWRDFTGLLNKIEARLRRQKHRFLYRGQADANWRLRPSLTRELFPKKKDIERCFEIERDAKSEFASQIHLHMDLCDQPKRNDWLEWWALMQHYRAPTRLLDWSASPYVAAYFAVETPGNDGVIWVVNDWAWGDRMKERYQGDWNLWSQSIRSTNDWDNVARSIKRDRFFNTEAESQILFFQPKRRSQRVVAQQGWLSTSLNPFVDYEEVIAELFDKHRLANQSLWEDSESWKYWNCRIIIPKEKKGEFLRRLQTMNISANSLFPGVDGLGRSVKEFVHVEVLHDMPGSSSPLP